MTCVAVLLPLTVEVAERVQGINGWLRRIMCDMRDGICLLLELGVQVPPQPYERGRGTVSVREHAREDKMVRSRNEIKTKNL